MRQTKIVLAFALSATLMACGKNQNLSDSSSSAVAGIYGGSEVEQTDGIAQSIVALYHTKEGYLCTGSLISNDLILTAAHCVQGDVTKMVVIFGRQVPEKADDAKNVVLRKVSNGKAYPGFDINHITATGMNDVGILKFDGGIPAGFKPATVLVNYKANIKNGSDVVMAGYGIDSRFFNSGAGTLRKVTLQVEDANLSPNETLISANFNKGICSGDSGGPSYLQVNGKYALWGITSRAGNSFLGLVSCTRGSTFTRVDSFWPWFQSTAAEMGSSLPNFPQTQN